MKITKTQLQEIIKEAFNVNSSWLFIYSLVPSIGSTNQKFLYFSFLFKLIVSSEIRGMLGVD